MFKLLDGKKLAQAITEQVAKEIIEENLEPQLGIVLVGDNPASHLYVKLKEQAAKVVGIVLHKYLIPESEDEQKIIDAVRFLNDDPDIDAVLIQVPLPKKFDQNRILEELDYRKDVDGFHRKNVERYVSGKQQHILPGLTLAIWNLIAASGEEHYKGKKALIIGKSANFLLPTQRFLHGQGLVVDVVRSGDPNLMQKSREADILITAIGKPKSITADMVKEGAVVIDIGISTVDGKTVGDVDFKNVAPKTSYITPVPGGVGPMTIAMLLYNTLQIAKLRRKSIITS